MIRSIMVLLDGSRFGEHALPHAAALARRFGGRIEVVHKHVPPAPIHPDSVLAAAEKVPGDTRPAERAYLDAIASRLSAAGISASTALVEGGVVEALCEHATASRADLVVMTTHGRGPLSRFWMGGVADALMRRSSVPLLLIRPSEEEPHDLAAASPPRRVLVPLDGSEEAEKILGPVAALGAAEYTLLRVIEPLPVYGLDVPLYGAPSDTTLGRRLVEHATQYLNLQAKKLQASGAKVRTLVVLESSPAAAILEEAGRGGYDLIALETHGRGGLARLVMGSVADKVVRGAAVPVLVHRTPPAPR